MATNAATDLPETPELLAERCSAAVQLVIDAAGGQTALAEKLSLHTGKRVRQSMVSMWKFRGRVAHEWVLPCEAVLAGKYQRYDIRPDLHTRDHSPGSSGIDEGTEFAHVQSTRN